MQGVSSSSHSVAKQQQQLLFLRILKMDDPGEASEAGYDNMPRQSGRWNEEMKPSV